MIATDTKALAAMFRGDIMYWNGNLIRLGVSFNGKLKKVREVGPYGTRRYP